MTKFHAYTTRNGRYVCGNMFNVNAIFTAKSPKVALERAHKLAKIYGKAGDLISVATLKHDGGIAAITRFTI